ncbi:hypothetical protein B4113_3841 [Geobacillus sp. B4113_201601]|nr:hypothetical protein B4113_3841 [Geobacillus sp. B4113_201601]
MGKTTPYQIMSQKNIGALPVEMGKTTPYPVFGQIGVVTRKADNAM